MENENKELRDEFIMLMMKGGFVTLVGIFNMLGIVNSLVMLFSEENAVFNLVVVLNVFLVYICAKLSFKFSHERGEIMTKLKKNN